MSGTKIVRRMRILEYVGPEDWVLETTENSNRYVRGMTAFTDKKYIREYLSDAEEIAIPYPGVQAIKDEEIPF